MAQYIANIRGQRGEASRLGSKTSGIYAHVRGWNVGARVDISFRDGKDVVTVWQTGGSNGRTSEKLIAEFSA